MSNKKGLSYVDWIISMSLFIIVVMMIFAFLRPGIHPTFESQDLIFIAESNFIAENTWKSISIPISIHNLGFDSLGNPTSIKIKQEPLSNWEFIGFYSKQDLNLLNIITTNTLDQFEITCSVFPCKTTKNTPSSQGIYLVSMEKTISSQNFEISDSCSTGENPSPCDYLIGSKETVTGLNREKIDLLKSDLTLYPSIKESWNFPKTRDFEVSIDYLDGTQENIISPDIKIPAQTNVFVKEIFIPILEKYGARTPTKISIKVW